MRCDCGASLVETTTCEQYKVESMVLVIANIPALKCPSCQAFFYEDEVLDRIDEIISTAGENINQKV
ncbi:MAG: hypothetical protein A4E53_01544 [Pelotomaculum sp. PtaB.Bin104]|nr:MAG: hypothetical protein A4E53_01544 [Pelotomaculum sp. PtaB.Bin104]